MNVRYPLILAFVLAPVAAQAARFALPPEHVTKTLPLEPAGSIWIHNESGDIEVVGAETPGIQVTATKTVRGVDDAALAEGRLQTQWVMQGDPRISYIRTIMPPVRSGRWESEVTYSLRVPRTAQVNIATHSSNVKVSNVVGRISIKNVNGSITLSKSTGPAIVESINGAIILDGRPSGDSQLTTVSGNVEVHIAPNAAFEWVADSISRDFRTTFPIQGRFVGKTFRGSMHSGGPTIRTASLLGQIFLLKMGTKTTDARPVETLRVGQRTPPPVAAPKVGGLRQPIVNGSLNYATTLGDVIVGEIRGDTRIETGGGEVSLGAVLGQCHVISYGGSLELGEIRGPLLASTSVGDVFVRSALQGGAINTAGGMVRVDFASGPMNITSLGGDIIVRRTNSPVIADTKSGDITITSDPDMKKARFLLRTAKGNIVLNIPVGLAADVDATVLVTQADGEMIRSEFKGLSITREQVQGKMRIRAVGKINGGGERIELYAEDGRITLGRSTR